MTIDSRHGRYYRMRCVLIVLLSFSTFTLLAQISEETRFLSRKSISNTPPPEILAGRTAVLFAVECSQSELEELQVGFQQLGIDAVSYSETEKALAGKDLMNAFGRYFKSRSVRFILFVSKANDEYKLSFLPFNARNSWAEPDQNIWEIKGTSIRALLQSVYRALIGSQKRQNLLVNDFPEKTGPNTSIAARREEDWAPGVRAQKIAIPRFGNKDDDAELERFLNENVKARYELVAADATEKELLDHEFVYILRFVHCKGNLAKEILGYDLSLSESALATTFYSAGALSLKTIPSSTLIYKYYLKQLEDDVYYFGRRWDADTTWQTAIKNHFDGYRASSKLP